MLINEHKEKIKIMKVNLKKGKEKRKDRFRHIFKTVWEITKNKWRKCRQIIYGD